MDRQMLQDRIQKLNSQEVNSLVEFLTGKGISGVKLNNLSKAKKPLIDALSEYFEGDRDDIAVDNALNDDGSIDFERIKNLTHRGNSKSNNDFTDNSNNNITNNNEGDVGMEQNNTNGNNAIQDDSLVNQNQSNDASQGTTGNEGKENKKGAGKGANGGKTKGSILKEYKTVDNLVYLTETKETALPNVIRLNEKMFSTHLTGSKLANLFLNGSLVFDPTMQRGVKEDKKGVERANFRESHVTDIYKSITEGTFTPTQIRFAVIIDDEDTELNYDSVNGVLKIKGKIRLLDGQHRVRALSRIRNEIVFDKLQGVDIDSIPFNVMIDYVTSDEARVIYRNIDKNLKLDKSQARQLSDDDYARIVNMLNQSPNSDLKGKIATQKPAGTKLVLFNNMADSIKKFMTISNVANRNSVAQYLTEFFGYVAEKLPEAFGNDEALRVKFRENNLLNENNFFGAWIKVASVDQDNYKVNVDKIVENIDFFNKDAKDAEGNFYWLEVNAVKYKKDKTKGFAMNNTSTGIDALVDKTIELLGYKNE